IERGGTLISRCRMSPTVTASRYSTSRSICQFGTNGVSGSRMGHACSTYARSDCSARLVSNASCAWARAISRSCTACMIGLLWRCRRLRPQWVWIRDGHRRCRAEEPRLPGEFSAKILFRHVRVRVPRRTDVDLLRCVEAPDLAVIRQRFPRFFEVARIAMLVLDDDFGHRGTSSTRTAVGLALAATRTISFAV